MTDIAELVARLPGASAPKLIAAGSTVAASITSAQGRGVMFVDIARRGNEIHRIRYFPPGSLAGRAPHESRPSASSAIKDRQVDCMSADAVTRRRRTWRCVGGVVVDGVQF